MKRLLIIDRDRLFLSCLKDFFELHFQVQTSYNGTAGLDLREKFQPDLIICDLTWPNFYGYQVLKTIRSDVTTAKIPFIFLSCFSEWEERDRALNLGANEYLSKPVRLHKLLSVINEQLESEEVIAV